jgi:ATP-binding protein involved in chromosome partitioning
MVTTPQEVALQDVYRGVSMCKKLDIRVLGVVENMSYFVDTAGVKHELFGSGGGQKVADYAEAPLIGQIPIDNAVRKWGDDGTPVVHAEPESSVAEAFTHIAETIARDIARAHFDRGGGKQVPATEGRKRLRIVQ